MNLQYHYDTSGNLTKVTENITQPGCLDPFDDSRITGIPCCRIREGFSWSSKHRRHCNELWRHSHD